MVFPQFSPNWAVHIENERRKRERAQEKLDRLVESGLDEKEYLVVAPPQLPATPTRSRLFSLVPRIGNTVFPKKGESAHDYFVSITPANNYDSLKRTQDARGDVLIGNYEFDSTLYVAMINKGMYRSFGGRLTFRFSTEDLGTHSTQESRRLYSPPLLWNSGQAPLDATLQIRTHRKKLTYEGLEESGISLDRAFAVALPTSVTVEISDS